MPSDWRELTLHDICTKITDGAHNSPQSVDSGFPMASVKDLTPYGVNLSTCRLISEEDFTRLVNQGCQPEIGDVLIAKDGATALDTVCEVRQKHELVLLSSVAILRPNQEVVTASFLRYYLDSDATRRYMKGNFVTGAAIPRVVLKDFKRAKICLPPLSVQHRIASILSAYDDLIDNNTRRIKILEQMAQTIYREWFVEFRAPGVKLRQATSDEKKVTGKDQFPVGWEIKLLKDQCERINYGYTASARQEAVGPKFLRITDIVPYLIDWDSVPHCEIEGKDVTKYRLADGDIVIARTGATTGFAKRLNKLHPEAVFASYLVRIRVRPECSNRYIGVIVESDDYKRFIKANLGGAAQPQANAQVLTSVPVVIPAQTAQEAFDRLVEPIFDQREVLQVKNSNLRRTRNLLLPRLVGGEVVLDSIESNNRGPIHNHA